MGRKNRRGHGYGHIEGEFRTTLASRYRIDEESGEEVKKPLRYVPYRFNSKPRARRNRGKDSR